MALLMMGGASCATKTSVLGVGKETLEPTNESTLAALARKWKQCEEKKIKCQPVLAGYGPDHCQLATADRPGSGKPGRF